VSRLVGAVSGVGRRGMLGGLVRSYLDFGDLHRLVRQSRSGIEVGLLF